MIDQIMANMGTHGKNIAGLVGASVSLLGRDKDIYAPLVGMWVAKLVRITIVFFLVYQMLIAHSMLMIFIAVIALLTYLPLEIYFYINYKAIASRMSYDTLRGEDTDMAKATKGLKGTGSSLFMLALIDYLVGIAGGVRDDEQGGCFSDGHIYITCCPKQGMGPYKKLFSSSHCC